MHITTACSDRVTIRQRAIVAQWSWNWRLTMASITRLTDVPHSQVLQRCT